jgi:hypothetical protein
MNAALADVASQLFQEDVIVPLVVPAVSMGAIVAVVAISLYFRYRTQHLRQDLYRSFLEKGEPIPGELLQPRGKSPGRNGDLRRGLVLLAGGIGLSIAVLCAHNPDAIGFALIGVAYLIVWKVELGSNQDSVRS